MTAKELNEKYSSLNSEAFRVHISHAKDNEKHYALVVQYMVNGGWQGSEHFVYLHHEPFIEGIIEEAIEEQKKHL